MLSIEAAVAYILVFAISEPIVVQRAAFFYIGRRFCVRGGKEQRKLEPSQFVHSTELNRYYSLGYSDYVFNRKLKLILAYIVDNMV